MDASLDSSPALDGVMVDVLLGPDGVDASLDPPPGMDGVMVDV